MTRKKESVLPESVKKAVAELGRAADNVEHGVTNTGPEAPVILAGSGGSPEAPQVPLEKLQELSQDIQKLDIPAKSALPKEVFVKVGWQERARRLKLVPKVPQPLLVNQKWKGVAKDAGKTALRSVGASVGYMVVMSAMAFGLALAMKSTNPEKLIGTFGSHDS